MDVISELASARGMISYSGGAGGDPMPTTTLTAKSPGVVAVLPEAPPHLQPQAADHGQYHGYHAAAAAAVLLLLRRTAQHAPRAPAWTTTTGRALAAPRSRRWRCRVCQVECGGRDGFREHCMSDEHYHGLQLFCLRPDIFADGIDFVV